ncbi:transcriptional regulator MntR [Oleiharenicola sp. Vm1]|uniref:transcriptional regulator MntR n=1 Tax=Oleiharenicola sp. Vm1 TaxID=3398393 RepID=UPI0039F57AA1
MATSASRPRTSVAAEDYLEKIEQLISRKGYARVVDIAAELKISQASVTAMVQKLDAEGFVKYEKYRGMVLTSSGLEVARRIAHRHQLLTEFLRAIGVADEKVIYDDVEGMEHHISPETFAAIEALTRYLEKNPSVMAKAAAAKK